MVTERYRLNASYAPDPAWAIAATVSLEPTSAELTADATWKPDRDTQVRVVYRASENQSSYYSGTQSIRVDASHRFPGGLVVTARGTYAPDRSLRRPTDFSAQAELSLPFGLPLRKRAVGRIAGTVKDVESGAGVADVILRIGQRIAITDLRGAFLFPDLPPGKYSVTVDTARVKADRLVAEKLPLTAEVVAGRDARLDVTLIAPARLSGSVQRYRTAEDGALVPATPLQDVLVELRRNGDVRKALTGRDGGFAFAGLPPGTWRLRFSTDGLPPYTAFAENDLEIRLSPGDAPKVDARVLDVRREMQMVDEGEIIEEIAPEDQGPRGK
jgi:hypothetical protein